MSVWDYVEKAKDYYNEYKGLVDAGAGAVKGYLDYKDQKRRNELDEKAYRDYMLEVASAGQEAQSAVDINLTPMEVTNIPTSKADVTDFTALAANGGIIGLKKGGAPNAGIAALRKKAPGVVKRMGFAGGTDPYEYNEDDPYEGMSVMEILKLEGAPTYNEAEFEEEFGTLGSKNKENTNMKMAEIPKDLTMDEAVRIFKLSNDRDPISIEEVIEFFKNRKLSAKGGIAGLRNGGRPGYMMGEGPVMDNKTDGTVSIEEAVTETEEPMEMAYNSGTAYSNNEGTHGIERAYRIWQILPDDIQGGYGGDFQNFFETTDWHGVKMQKGGIASLKKGGRVKRAGGGVMDLGGMEKDYRFNGGFVPIGEYEKKDDVPARLSKNEFVFTADAVRAAGGGSINKGAQKMYNTMKTLEAKPQAKRMTA
jgi:hypothetical protein